MVKINAFKAVGASVTVIVTATVCSILGVGAFAGAGFLFWRNKSDKNEAVYSPPQTKITTVENDIELETHLPKNEPVIAEGSKISNDARNDYPPRRAIIDLGRNFTEIVV